MPRWPLERFSPWPIVLAVLLLDPLVLSVTPDSKNRIALSWPQVQSGDEPHYLVMLHSLLKDGDLDVANNYASVHAGSNQAGAHFAGWPLDHHVRWYDGDDLRIWWQIYENDPKQWQHDRSGDPVPTLRAGVARSAAPRVEFSWHPPGLPLLLAVLLFPLRETKFIEPAAILCSTLAVLAAIFAFRWLISPYTADTDSLWLATTVAFLGTPAWHYGTTLFCEPYLMAFAVGAYAAALRWRGYLIAGSFIALGVLMKPPFALLAFPLAVDCARGGRRSAILGLATPIALSVCAILALNFHMHGSCFKSPIRWESGRFLGGLTGLLVSPAHGLLPFAPAALVAAAAWPTFWMNHRRDAVVLSSGFSLYFLLMSAWASWHGSTCYGPRMIVPVIPFVFAAIPWLPHARWWRNPAAKFAAVIVCAASIGINAIGAFAHPHVWDKHPLGVLATWLTRS